MVEYKAFELGHFALQKGVVLPDAKVVYATVGQLNDAKDNVVLFPTWGSGTAEDGGAAWPILGDQGKTSML